MKENEILETIVFPALRTAHATMPGLSLENPSPGLVLYGADGAVLDSLNLVSFVFILEEEVRKASGKNVTITVHDLIGQDVNPFSSLPALATFLRAKIEAP